MKKKSLDFQTNLLKIPSKSLSIFHINPIQITLIFFFFIGYLSLETRAANGTAYYFDVNGTTAGFGSPAGSYSINGNYWSTTSDGTGVPSSLPSDVQLTFGNQSSDFSGNTFTIDFDDDRSWLGMLVNANNANITFSGSNNGYLNGTQTWTIASGSVVNMNMNYNGVGLNMNGSDLTLDGGGTLNWTTAAGYNCNGSKVINQNGAGLIVNLSSAAGNASQASYTLTQGTLNIASSAVFNKMLGSENAKLIIDGGTINNTSGADMTLDLNTGTYEIAGNFTFTGTHNLNLNTHSVALSTASTITTTANTLTIGGTISGNNNLIKAGAGSIVFTNNTISLGSLTISAGTLDAGSSTINLTNNFSTSGTFTANSGTVVINGSSTQTIGAASFNNLTIDNSTAPASSAATLTGNITVNGALTLTTGILNTNGNTINLGSSATISEINPNATAPTSYVTGYVSTTRNLIQNITNTFGGIGLSLTETTQASNSTAITRQTGTSSGGSILRYFDISPTVNSALNATIAFSYFDNELNSQDESGFKLYKSSDAGSTWANQSSSSVNTATNTVSLSGITSFSRWTSSNPSTNPVPVIFKNFTATYKMEGCYLKWETTQEVNNDYFEIESSNDGINFEKIGTVKGTGNSNTLSTYSYLDNSTNSTLATYYRLKQLDFDKKYNYSNIVFVTTALGFENLTLYPNPLEEGQLLSINLSNKNEHIEQISIYDISGKPLDAILKTEKNNYNTISLENQLNGLTKGFYVIEVKTSYNTYKQKLKIN